MDNSESAMQIYHLLSAMCLHNIRTYEHITKRDIKINNNKKN